MLKPFVVTLETDIVVMAEDTCAAEVWTRKNWYRIESDDLGQHNFDISARKMTYYPGNWDKDCLPYGSTDDKTLGEILDNDEEYQAKLKELRELAAKHKFINGYKETKL